jgi:hypothetical protein
MALDGAVKRMPSAEATSPAPQILTSGSAAWEDTIRALAVAMVSGRMKFWLTQVRRSRRSAGTSCRLTRLDADIAGFGDQGGAQETVQKVGGAMGPPGRCSREFGMKWRVMLELVGPDGIVGVHEVGGRAAVAEHAPRSIGLTLEEGKHLLAALQIHLVQAQAEDHSRRRRRCQRCGAQRPLKDQRSRRLVSLFGTMEVRAPRFTPCRCAVTCRRTLNPIAEIMPDRCTPEYERTVAKMGSLLPYRRGADAQCPPSTAHACIKSGNRNKMRMEFCVRNP